MARETHIQLCGELRIRSGDAVVEAAAFPGRQGRLAFAYLATHRRAVPRDELAEAIWPDKLPRSWEHDLAAVVSKLRGVLAKAGLKDTLVGKGRAYELRIPERSVDIQAAAGSADEAEEAQGAGDAEKALAASARAAEISRRAFMVGEEAEWIERCRADQSAILVRALGVSAELYGERGDTRTAIAHATEAVALEPYNETGYVRLMKLHLASGNRAEAVRTYERCRALLAEELGVDPSPETEAVYLEALRSRAGAPTKSKVGKGVTIMLVDDHPLWLETLRQTLERAGVGRIVAEATNGKEALELAAEAKPQVVIMDMELPVLDGVKATRRILAKHPGTKVLVLSASSDDDLVVRAVRAGAHGYLLKTAIADDVADAVRRVASGEMVLPAEVAGIVLAELRGTAKKRPLATVLITDIVSSTERAAKIGDRKWSGLLTRHNEIVRRAIAQFHGRHVDSAGDGVLATFDGPAQAVRCACAIRDTLRPIGIEVRAGLHTGEIELAGDDVRGIAVHIGQRVSALAEPGEVLVSRTVTDLVSGSGLQFEERGEHELKGVPGRWAIYAVKSDRAKKKRASGSRRR